MMNRSLKYCGSTPRGIALLLPSRKKAIRNAVLMIDDVLSDERELGAMVEATVYKHMVSFYQGSPASLVYFRKAKTGNYKLSERMTPTESVGVRHFKFREYPKISSALHHYFLNLISVFSIYTKLETLSKRL